MSLWTRILKYPFPRYNHIVHNTIYPLPMSDDGNSTRLHYGPFTACNQPNVCAIAYSGYNGCQKATCHQHRAVTWGSCVRNSCFSDDFDKDTSSYDRRDQYKRAIARWGLRSHAGWKTSRGCGSIRINPCSWSNRSIGSSVLLRCISEAGVRNSKG